MVIELLVLAVLIAGLVYFFYHIDRAPRHEDVYVWVGSGKDPFKK